MSAIKETLKIIQTGGAIVYPTDTIWGLGCDATDQAAVENVYKIKNRSESKSLIILVDGMAMLEQYVDSVPEIILNFLKSAVKPTTVIYNHPKGLAANVIADDDSVAIRVVQNDFCKALIQRIR